ncbi:adhesive plaque matrix protein isoform X2 [Carassius gibelio]|uniref:adhesive plaque matrix protein isoform X2 n=1 Tax=Carassius gibelio TaxID=101364 RepID=UPI0022797688|nr:adhesive plaque matrix protein isoform X2 [Carassius gibelio]
MNTCGYFPVLCVLSLVFQDIFCSEFANRKYALSMFDFHDDISSGDIFKSYFWLNSKQRRSVKPGDGQLQTRKTKPRFECGDRVLTLLLKHVDVTNIRFYGPRGDLLHLNHLAAFCGVSIRNTNTDIRLLINYDSCYMRREPTKHVLSLSWYGADLDLSCPVSVTPPSITCKNNNMELTVGDGTADELSVALNGEWAPLLYVATQCWHRKLSKEGGLAFLVAYTSCGVTIRDDRSHLKLKLKDKVITLSCPHEPRPVFPIKDSGLSVTNQQLPQRVPNVYQKQPIGFPTKAIASQIVEEQAFSVEEPAGNAARAPSRHRSPLLPKIPPLPGSFNLAVNFPFSLPIPTRPAPRDHLESKHVAPALTYAPTIDPTVPSSEFSSNIQNGQSHVPYAQAQQELDPVTKAPKPESHHMHYPHFESSASTHSQTGSSPALQYQLSRAPVPSAAPYQSYGSAQNFPKPNPLEVNPAFASLAQYIPPGYFLCSDDGQKLPLRPQMFRPPVPNQPSQYQNPRYQKPDTTPLEPANPDRPPMKGYSEHQLTSDVASSSLDSGAPLYQPTQHFQPPLYQRYFYQNGYGHQGPTRPLSSTSQRIPINLQSQTRPYPPYPASQDSRPFQPQYYQKPSQPYGSIQQPWSTRHFPVKVVSQDSRPFMSASSQRPEYLQYQSGGDQSPNPYQRSVIHNPGTGISSHSQYQPNQFSKLLYPPLRPEVLSGAVSTENTQSSSRGFLQPRSQASIQSPLVYLPSLEKTEAQVAQVPYNQDPSFGYMQNPDIHSERPSEPRSLKPQNDTIPPLRPEVLSGDVSTENTGASTVEFFQPRFKALSPPAHLPLPDKTEAQVKRIGEPRSWKPQNDTLPQLRPEVLSGDVSTENAETGPVEFLQPRFKALSPPAHLPLPDKTEAQVERPGEPRSWKPQNDTLPLHQFFRRARLPKKVYVPPHFRSA